MDQTAAQTHNPQQAWMPRPTGRVRVGNFNAPQAPAPVPVPEDEELQEPHTTDSEAEELQEHSQLPFFPGPPDFPFTSLATILVGPDEYCFSVHKEILSRASAFFNAAFSGPFLESNGTIRLPEQEVFPFKCFIRWMYTRRLAGFHDTTPPSLRQTKVAADEEAKRRGLKGGADALPWNNPLRLRRDLANYCDLPLLLLVKLYVLADVLQVPGLQDMVITCIHYIYHPACGESAFWRQGDDRPAGLENPVESINLVWAMTPERSLIRMLLVRMVSGLVRDVYETPFDETLDPEFVREVSQTILGRFKEGKERGDWEGLDMAICDFHTHDAGCPRDKAFPVYG